MPHIPTAPHSAAEAAHQLARQGAHVHLVSEGHSTCLKGCCGPEPLTLPDTVRERARLTRLTLAIEAQRR
ncbi:hypothetical protein [Streptomyces ossamyceticus]|uniref:hypothetical protein n=1 Tax=Streptomyces ossamyceticus TaxID=249581 RepID=UPI0006E277A1|nr:hypothetical protein [Streptomyces ossamyceticus]